MRELRTCTSAQLNTGVSKCAPKFGKMKGAILVERGHKLPAKLTADMLEKLAHADRPERIYGIVTFTEYAKNGGEVQTSANGYGGEEVTGLSARKDTFTLDNFYPELYAALTKTYAKKWDVYFFDENGILYGLNDGSDLLVGFPMTSVYADATPHPTSSARETMSVTFAFEDAEEAAVSFDYIELPFKPQRLVLGLTAVKLEKVEDNKYKLVEAIGGYDCTAIYGELIAKAGAEVINGSSSAVSYNADDETLTITATGDVSLKAPSVLYEKEIVGIEQV